MRGISWATEQLLTCDEVLCSVVVFTQLPCCSSNLTNQLSPWSWIFLKKLTVPQHVKKLQASYEPRSIIMTFTRTRQLSLLQSSPPLPSRISLRSVLIFSTSWSSKWSVSFKFLHPIYLYFFPLPYLLDCHFKAWWYRQVCRSKLRILCP